MLIARLVTAAVLLAACIGAMFLLPPLVWSLIVLTVMLAAGYALGGLAVFAGGGRLAFCSLLLLPAVAIHLAFSAGGGTTLERAIYAASCCFWLLVVPAWLARGWGVRGMLAAAVGWIALVPAWLALARLQ